MRHGIAASQSDCFQKTDESASAGIAAAKISCTNLLE
jgi:hypothetical protein